ncbi:class I SAM-dependent DNA methyltransferase [Flavobacterium sp. ENC]|uniref:HsdM family class I SAM-dependent methyltransferase n=1 Tax=Flavobacterium sp. ENC TaxID=2897330 RepID=UPI001E5B2C7A|nr:DNA methyltransferase [Flavobacterium sp. ENC]MCD0464386.1 Eco57I restriction-modification methylase domain-containing protein [Flavobacterium sp. ENC]
MGKVQENEFLVGVLKELEFFSSDSSIENNFPEIVFTKNPPQNLRPKHYIALEFASGLDADAVYFKYYDDNRDSVAQVYFYDNENSKYDKNKIAEIHRNVYSSSQVPLITFIDKNSISLFDTRIPVYVEDQNTITNEKCIIEKSYSLENELYILSKYFNAKKLNSGEFWESKEASLHFKNNTSAYEELVNSLSLIRKSFHKVFQDFDNFKDNPKDANDFADEILFKCILIKYLEENGLEDAQEFYKKSDLPNSLNKILEANQLNKLLDKLDFHFNGNVFFIENERKNLLNKLDLSSLALCLDGRFGSNTNLYLWEMYSFKHIPIELISNFYEEFIPKDKENSGTVYTPSHLVNLLIDECLPLSDKEEDLIYNVRLADVSCGSGIFITTAFKRLVQRWRVKNRNEKTGKLATPTLKIVKKILSDNIFGIDLHPTSVKLTKFSLQLALCQLVPNKELWTWNEDKVFKDLQNINIHNKDFFDFLVENKDFHNSLDLIIGNPPFQSLKEDKKIKEYSLITKKLKENINFEFSVKIPDNQLALMFLEASSLLLKNKAELCFIQKSTSLLYNSGAKEFRNALFNQFHVHQIIDFTLLKNDLFKSKSREVLDENQKPILDNKGKPKKSKNTSVESCAVFYKKELIEQYTTSHVVSRLLKNTKDGLSFEFDYYDFYDIPKEIVLNDNTIWRCNLLGGNRLNHLIKKLNKKTAYQTNLENYISNYLHIDKDLFCEGFIKGTPQGEKDEKNFYCEYITNKNILTASNFEKNKFDKFLTNQKFYRAPIEGAFKGPLITIKEQIKNSEPFIKIHFEDVAFDSRIVGFSFSETKNGSDIAKRIYNILVKNKKINALKTLSTCSQFFLGSSSVIQKADINNWTIPLGTDEINLSFSEKIIMDDVLDYIYPSWYEGEKADINKYDSSNDDLLAFADIFNQSFNSVYKKDSKEQVLKKIHNGKTFYALEFQYGENIEFEGIIDNEVDINDLIINEFSTNSIIKRVMRIYRQNSIFLIKPKNLRYWLKSIALRDADDIFDDMIKNGY